MNKIIIALSIALASSCDQAEVEEPETWTAEFISYNGISEVLAAVKCDGFGYDDSHPDHHAACVRMVRAD